MMAPRARPARKAARPASATALAVQTAVVMLLVATSALLGTYLTEVQAPQALAKAVSDFTSNKWVVLALLNVLFLFLGMFLHSAAAIILVVPIVMPLVRAVGIDPIHFGLIVTVNLGLGQQTPPVASVLMVASSISKSSVTQAVTKEALRRILRENTPDVEDLIRRTYGSEDFREGVTAFTEQRPPVWRGR